MRRVAQRIVGADIKLQVAPNLESVPLSEKFRDGIRRAKRGLDKNDGASIV